jgi:integration host factor subunit alpha
MRKADITTELFDKIGISKKEGTEILEIILSTIKDVLKKGEVVKIAGFGNFVVRQKKERKGRNPKTGEEIGITPRKVVTFRPSQVFKKYVNLPESERTPEPVEPVLKEDKEDKESQDHKITL